MASKSAFGIHFYVSLAVSGFLAMVNLITGIIPPWCLIPITSLAVPLAIHGGVQSAVQSSLRDRLKRMLRGARQTEAYEEEAGPPEYLEALKLKAKIIKQVETSGPGQKELISELMPVLEQYMEAIKVLGIQSRKYSALLDSINVEEWQEEKKELEARLETAKTPGLKKEYTQVLEHLNKQIKSVDSLAEKEELVQVRIRSSLSSLKKMQMDLVLREDVATHMAVLKETRTRLEELQQYTEDLEEGFRELDDEF
jgi:BMFP domain-containing protein YqiC